MNTSKSSAKEAAQARATAGAAQFRGGTVTQVLSSADSSVADGLESMKQVQQARLAQQKRALNAAIAQYGAKSAQAQAAQASVTATQRTTARLTVSSQQATTPQPTVDANGWALQGRVYGNNLQPRADYTVFLVDDQKNYLSAYGFAYTDNTGYFLINYPGPAAGQTQSTPDLFLEITNLKAQPVYLSTTAFQPVLGTATYQNITLPAGEPVLGNPPDEIRRVAMPPKGQKSGS